MVNKHILTAPRLFHYGEREATYQEMITMSHLLLLKAKLESTSLGWLTKWTC